MKPCLSTKTQKISIARAFKNNIFTRVFLKGAVQGKFYLAHHTECCLKFFLTFLSPPKVPHTWPLLNFLHSVCMFSNYDPSYQPHRIRGSFPRITPFFKRQVPKNSAEQNSSQISKLMFITHTSQSVYTASALPLRLCLRDHLRCSGPFCTSSDYNISCILPNLEPDQKFLNLRYSMVSAPLKLSLESTAYVFLCLFSPSSSAFYELQNPSKMDFHFFRN